VEVDVASTFPPDLQAKSRIGASPEAIRKHYDVGEDFFRLWLGPDLVYSAALFEGADDLASAQMRKLDHHIAAVNASGAARVLEVGCGWGSLLRRLVEHAGVGHAVGLTLSSAQAAWVRRDAGPRIEVREESWQDHTPETPYDAIISIEAFEHFARPGLSPDEKLAAYREFFGFCSRVLREGGRLSLQTTAYVESGTTFPLIIDEYFPETALPFPWEPIAAADPHFELLALRNDRDHFTRTLRLWERNLDSRRAEAALLVGEAAVAHFLRYLRLAAMAFKSGNFCLLRLSFAKRA
jgi:cyclopropane-fatty-acyl-phospholipid synthase